MRRKITRLPASLLTSEAKARATEAQRPVLTRLLETGFEVTKVLSREDRCAISLAHPTVSGWLTPDGVFHRPVKGRKNVSVSTTTLERVW